MKPYVQVPEWVEIYDYRRNDQAGHPVFIRDCGALRCTLQIHPFDFVADALTSRKKFCQKHNRPAIHQDSYAYLDLRYIPDWVPSTKVCDIEQGALNEQYRRCVKN